LKYTIWYKQTKRNYNMPETIKSLTYNNLGESFLHQQNDTLHLSKPVTHEMERLKEVMGNISNKPAEKIANFMKVLEKTHGHRDDPKVMDRIKNFYHTQFVIKPQDVPYSTFELEQKIARNLGYGDIEITEEFKQQKTKEIVEAQESSLDKWVDYLTSNDAVYPMWSKYLAFNSVLNMGKVEKKSIINDGEEREEIRFSKRDSKTIAPFAPMNPRALALTIGTFERTLITKVDNKTLPKGEKKIVTNESNQLTDEEFNTLANTQNFAKIYAQFLKELPEYSIEGLKETRGEWVVYKQGTDPQALVNSLEGYPLEWCTANYSTANSQLDGGDFHVYYSLDTNKEPKIPRVAIRMQGEKIAEVRGIAPNQNLDPYISPVIDEKLGEFVDGEAYKKKSSDMKRLTEIETEYTTTNTLSSEQLRFIYEIDNRIEGFGYCKDPRINELLEGRDRRQDIAMILNLQPHEISFTVEEALEGGKKYHYGDLYLRGVQELQPGCLPSIVQGHLNLGSLRILQPACLPTTVQGYLYLNSVQELQPACLPTTVQGELYLRSVQEVLPGCLPIKVGGSVILPKISAKNKEQLRKERPNLTIL
jgi:hypothetical protein